MSQDIGRRRKAKRREGQDQLTDFGSERRQAVISRRVRGRQDLA